MIFGNMPNDGGHLILSADERAAFVSEYPELAEFVRRLVGADDLINGAERYCLWLVNVKPEIIRQNAFIKDQSAPSGRVPKEKHSTNNTTSRRDAVSVWRGSPDRRPICNYSSPLIREAPLCSSGISARGKSAHDSCLFLPNAEPWEFGLITSRMHMAWLRNIGGRLKSDYRYSIGIVYDPFPWIGVDEEAREKINGLAQAVLVARKNHRIQRLPIFTTRTRCPLICARRIQRSTWRLMGSIARSRS